MFFERGEGEVCPGTLLSDTLMECYSSFVHPPFTPWGREISHFHSDVLSPGLEFFILAY